MAVITTDTSKVEELGTTTSSFGLYNAYKGLRTSVETIVGETTYTFTPEFFETINTFIIKDNKHMLTLDQQKLIDEYFLAADGLEDRGSNTDTSSLSVKLDELDIDLGEYKGEVE